MAANDYFNSSSNFDPRFNENNPPPPSSAKPTPIYTSPNPSSPTPYDNYGGRHPNRASQNTLFSEPDYYPGNHGGRTGGPDQYADDIPLKSNARQSGHGQGNWMNENTQYPPSPESQRLPPLDNSSRDRSRGKGFFKKKIAWVVWLNTVVQVAVFIVEIVRNGMCELTFVTWNLRR